MAEYKKVTLPNGVRFIAEELKEFHSVAIGICALIGSRYETDSENGLSHFIEHMMFKGTKNRTARQIALEIDALGGMLNASTTKEYTYFYTKVVHQNQTKAFELLVDILQNPSFPQSAFKVEKNVVLQEIKNAEDTPDDLVFFELAKALFNGHPLSNPVLGTKENVQKFKREDLVKFYEENYTLDNLIISAAGRINYDALLDIASKINLKPKKKEREELPLPVETEKLRVKRMKGLKQVYIAMATRTFPYVDERKYPLMVLGTLFGGGMGSRLFQRLREKEGLVYLVASFPDFFKDTGVFGIYFVTSKNLIKKAFKAIFEEMEKFVKKGIKKNELNNAKEHLKGGMVLVLEDTSSRMSRLLKQEIYLGKQMTVDEVIQKVENVKIDDVMGLAEEFLEPSKYSVSAVGDISEKDFDFLNK